MTPNESDGGFTIDLNGEPFVVDGDARLTALIDRLSMTRRRVAIEINCAVVPKALWGEVVLKPGDSIEIVTFVGGG
jgi:sulfur carrier protein